MLQRLVPVLAAGGPLDVLGNAPVGVLAEDLRAAALLTLQVPRDNCRAFAMRHNWDESARRFLCRGPGVRNARGRDNRRRAF